MGPNDIWIRPDGGLYLTDPFYKRAYWKHASAPQDREAVYYLSPDRRKLTRVVDDLKQPNGIIGTPDGKTLYIADIGAGRTYSYDIGLDGTLANKTLFCKMGSDGMTIDDQGNVYLTGKGVTVFDKSGKQIEHIAINEPWTANVCFGGADRRTLFVTASKGLYAIRLQVQGRGQPVSPRAEAIRVPTILRGNQDNQPLAALGRTGPNARTRSPILWSRSNSAAGGVVSEIPRIR